MKNNNIIKVRKKLDLLDNRFLNLIKRRSILINKILKEKTSIESVAETVCYLLSESSFSITGQNIFVDSGTI